jgi:hypothetical protein
MTNWEKAKWAWNNFCALIVCAAYASVAAVALGDACWRTYHHEWLQCGKDLPVVVICLGGGALTWKFYQWTNGLFKRWIDKAPKT